MSRISLAFKSFFAILFKNYLPERVAEAYGYSRAAAAPPPRSEPQVRTSDGAMQILGILQRDARLIDFLMEDIAPYSDDQVGAAVRNLHAQSRETLTRYVRLTPIIDGVEGTATQLAAADPGTVKLIGNVPVNGIASKGILRHRGWRVERVELPRLSSGTDVHVLAPAEVEVE